MRMEETDEFGRFVMTIVHKQQLIQGLFEFLDLAKKNNVDIGSEILFVGEYQRLLFESIILDISYILLDKMKADKSRMQIEISKVESKLKNDIETGKADFNFTIIKKKEILDELMDIKSSKEYKEAIKAITTTRNKFVAHKDSDFSSSGILYEQLPAVVKNIRRCYEIRQLALKNVGEVYIKPSAEYNPRNVIEALMLQREIRTLHDNLDCGFYPNMLNFWNEAIKPRMMKGGDSSE